MITLSVNGIENYVASGDCVTPEMNEALASLGFIDLRNEAQTWSKNEIDDARKFWHNQQMSILSTIRQVNTNDVSWSWMRSKDYAPQQNSLKPIDYDTEYMKWLSICNNQPEFDEFGAKKIEINLLHEKVNSIREQGRDFYLQLLSVLFTSDVNELLKCLFPFPTVQSAITWIDYTGSFDVVHTLRPIFNIFDRVNGRGELLTLFLFADAKWNRGVGYHDITCEDGSNFHVKELQGGSVRLGKSSYSTCKLCERLVELSKRNDWQNVGRCDVRNSLTKGVIEANKELLTREFGDFEKVLHDEMLNSEKDTTGVIFYKKDRCYPRLMNDCVVDCASKGDFKILPRIT